MNESAVRGAPLSPLGKLIPVVIAVFALSLTVGGGVLAFGNIGWLQQGDTAQHYLGWAFYRLSPWGFPIGLNPDFGLELSSSIVFSDSIPLLAILFKPLSPWLPDNFQYFGLWVWICFILQATFGFRLAGLFSRSLVICSIACSFFVLAPTMLLRLGGHLALSAHFLILAMLFYSLKGNASEGRWARVLLVPCAALVHPYLLVMVLAIWLAGMLDRLRGRQASWQSAAAEVVVVMSLLLVVCWQAGYFAVSGGPTAWGYGFYRANVLSPFDSNGWSRLLPDIPSGEGEGEGFAYLGMGGLFLVLAAVVGAILDRGRRARRVLAGHMVLVIALLLMVVYSWSDQLGVGRFHFDTGYGRWLGGIKDTFRATGRFVWPAYYAVMLAAIAALASFFRLRVAIALLVTGLGLQLYDTSAGWRSLAHYRTEAGSAWQTPLSSPFWSAAASHYKKLRVIPPANMPPDWRELASYAVKAKMATDAVYLARIDQRGLERLALASEQMLASGRFDRDTLFVLDERSSQKVRGHLGSRDLLVRVDGHVVLAPDGRDCAACVGALPDTSSPDIVTGEAIVGAKGARLISGWSDLEQWGVWTDGRRAKIEFDAPLPGRFLLLIEGYGYGPNAGRQLLLHVGDATSEVTLPAQTGEMRVSVDNAKGARVIEFEIPSPTQPSALGSSKDNRHLGLALVKLRVEKIDYQELKE